MNFNRFFRIIHPDEMKRWAIFAPIAFIGLVTVNHYGISIDEHVHLLILKWNWELIQEGKPIPVEGLRFYGIVFDGAAELFFQVKHWLETHLLGRTPWVPYFSANNPEIMTLDRFLTKHIFTFFVSLIAYLSVAGGVTLLSGKKWAWLAPLILALFPRFWGKGFFDPKDIPFAALFSLCIYLGAHGIVEINRDTSPPIVLGIQRKTVLAIAYGVVVGLLSGIRIGGFIIFVFLGLILPVLISRYLIGRSLKDCMVNYSVAILSWGLTVFCLTPAAWSNPFHWFWDAISYLSNHEWSGSVLFKGEMIKASELSWDYLPTWFLITSPSLFLFYFLLGLIGLIRDYRQFSDRQKAYSLLVILQIFMLPTVAIVKGSTLYDGLRHFLFVIPGMAVVTTFGFIWLYQQLDRPKFKRELVAVTVLGMAIVLFDMVTLHPYEYVYFNRVFGGVPQTTIVRLRTGFDGDDLNLL